MLIKEKNLQENIFFLNKEKKNFIHKNKKTFSRRFFGWLDVEWLNIQKSIDDLFDR